MKFDNDVTLSEVFGRRFCINPETIRRWMKRKCYTSKHFKKMIEETKNFERFLSEVLN